MPDRLQEAEERFKAGDRDRAQQLLAEIICHEPDNEKAWLMLASMLTDHPRQFCLQLARQIRPGSPQDSKTERIIDNEDFFKGQEGKDSLEEPQPLRIDEPKPSEEIQFWVIPKGREIYLIILDKFSLLKVTALAKQRKQIVEDLSSGNLPDQYFKSSQEISINKIISVVQNHRVINVEYNNESPRFVDFDCTDDEMATTFLNALGRKLGPEFERQFESSRMNSKIIGTFLLFLVAAIITYLMFLGSLDISTGNATFTLGEQVTGFLGTIGPIGVLAIGGALMLGAFISMIIQYLRPPKKIKLIREKATVATHQEL